MKEINNLSYARIITFLRKNKNIKEEEKRMLISYATQLLKHNIENKQLEDMSDILVDLKYITDNLKNPVNSPLNCIRAQKVVYIMQMISDFYNSKKYSVEEISYQLDKLYMEMELPIRKNSGLSYNLDNNIQLRK